MAPIEGSSTAIYCGSEAYFDKLRALLDQDGIRDLPLYILAVAGEYRTGKSFLLSYFLRYLYNQGYSYSSENSEKNPFIEEDSLDLDDENPFNGDLKNCVNWLGEEDEPLIGFDHKYDDKSVTRGINIWDQPLVVERQKEDGSVQKILVLLMDSQGIFSAQEEEEATRIFALTTMISSVLVFNLTHQLNDAVLNYLQLFTAYAKMATIEEINKTPFQKLMLLIRDWAKKDIKPYGAQGGNEYFHEYFQGKRHFLRDTFREIECYLMPRPGDCVEESDYNGCLKELRGVFRKHLKDLTESLLDPSHLVLNLKEVTGQTITAGDFCDYFKDCTELLADVDWKQPHSMLKMHTSFNCNLAKREAVKLYKEYMDTRIQVERTFMSEEQLQDLHKNATIEAKSKYEDKCSFTRKNDLELYTEDLQKLIEELAEVFKIYKQRWESEKEKRRLQEMLASAQGCFGAIKNNCGNAGKAGGAAAVGTGVGATVGTVAEVGVGAIGLGAAAGVGAGVGGCVIILGILAYVAYKKNKVSENENIAMSNNANGTGT